MQAFVRCLALLAVVLLAALTPCGAQGLDPSLQATIRPGYFADANYPPRVSRPGVGFSLARALAQQHPAAAQRPQTVVTEFPAIPTVRVLPQMVEPPLYIVPTSPIHPSTVPPILESTVRENMTR